LVILVTLSGVCRLKAIGLYASAFALGSAAVDSHLIVTGNPFYNDQGLNVWFPSLQTDYLRVATGSAQYYGGPGL
jgi:hypothetical protein